MSSEPKMPAQNLNGPTRDLAVNRKCVNIARFAGALGSRLDAHPGSGDAAKIEAENRIIALARKTLGKADPDPCSMNFLTQAVEMHMKARGFSQAIYDELLRLYEQRTDRD